MTKWITRLRPIYFQRIPSDAKSNIRFDEKDNSVTVNEAFAILVSLNTIATELKVENIHLDPEFHADLTYDLHYRTLSADALMAIYSLVRNSVKRKSMIMKVIRRPRRRSRKS